MIGNYLVSDCNPPQAVNFFLEMTAFNLSDRKFI